MSRAEATNEVKRNFVRGVPLCILDKLPDKQKKVLAQRFLGGDGEIPSIRKLADGEGVSPNAVLEVEQRALNRLRKLQGGRISSDSPPSFSGRPRLILTEEQRGILLEEGAKLTMVELAERLGHAKDIVRRWRRELNLPPLNAGRPRKNVVK